MIVSLISKFSMSVDNQSSPASRRRSLLTVLALSLGGSVACSSGYEEAPVGEFADPPGSGSKTNLGGDENGGGGVGGDSMGGRDGFGGAVTGPDPDPADAPQCPVDAIWGGPNKLQEISSELGDERLLAVSPDERTIIFQRDGASYFADRAKPADDFSAISALTVPDGYDVELGLALTPDGLTLVLTRDDSSGFAEITRESRGDAFSLVADEARYLVLNTLYPMAGIELSHPVISGAGGELWWVETLSETSVWFASYATSEIARGEQVGCNEFGCDLMLDGYDGAKKLLTGLSNDRLTVFLVDDDSGQEARSRVNSAVDTGFFVSLGLEPRLDVRPNAACTRLYYSSGGDIFFDTR